MKTNTARTLAALNATNEAILYAKSPEELYEKVCEAAFSSGGFLATAVFLLIPGTNLLRFAAGFGEDTLRLRSIDISVEADTPEGSGVCGQAFRDQKLCISNDYLNDARSLAWRQGAAAGQVGAAACLPLTCNGHSVGVFLVTRHEPGSIDGPIVALLERMSANLSFALDNFDHEASRKDGERAMRRLNRMFGAISATNEAILRAKTEQELYQRVCDAAVYSGKSVATVVLLAEPDSTWLKPAAGSGESLDLITRTRFSIDADNEYGKGIAGEAFRTRQPCVNHDIAKGGPWQQVGLEAGVVAAVGLPLIKADQVVGVVMFFVGKAWAADEEIMALLVRIAENVSFALDNFGRAEAKEKADEQKQRLTRMFAALSATNEAIMRAKSRTEMFDLVCRAAAQGGRFNSTSILLVRPDSDFLDMVGVAGPTAENARRVKVSIDGTRPEGRGLCGTAFQTRQRCISNDFPVDPRGTVYRSIILAERAKSGAAFPLLIDGQPVGVMLFISAETDTFTAEFAELLQRLADNVSFALGSFDRADEKAKTEEQKERLTRMFAALGATNEAIMRAKSRTEMFELVCEAATVGGNFTSTAIVLERSGADFFENVAAAGPDRERAINVKLSADAARPEGQGITGIAFRTRRPFISNDYLTDFGSSGHFFKVVRDSGTRSGAALPLLKDDRAVGVIVFLSSELGAFSPELIGLLQRLAENISFALDNFDRVDEKARSEGQKESLTRMLAALSATNEAIVRAGSRDELYQLVCEAAATGGKFTSTTIALAVPGSNCMEIVAGAGPTSATARQVTLSIREEDPEGRGVCGITFRSGQACIFNDYLADPRAAAFHEKARREGSRSGAGFPLFVRGQVVGVMLYVAHETNAFTPEFTELLQRLADNVSFALENFERADEKARTEGQKEDLTRMLAALSATNEAIVRASTRSELFDLVCQATAKGGKFTATSIALKRSGSDYLEVVAAAGPTAASSLEVRLSSNEAHPEGQGSSGMAIRSGKPCIINDYRADTRSQAFHARAVRDGTRSGGAFPLFVRGQVVGVLICVAIEKDTFTPEFSELLQRLTDNVSFALENFERADEKAKTEEQKERLTRMLAALSATNEAIVRANSRSELFELVCEATAKGGKFTSTSIGLVRPDSDYLDFVAAAGPTADSARKVKASVNEAHPEGRGLSGTAIRSRQPCIINDYLTDARGAAFHAIARNDSTQSGAGFPLLVRGQVVGIIIFISPEKHTFTPEFADLLKRLTDNVSFALENFDRADEKTKADERIEYLASHDSLTNLPNREMFNGLLRRTIDASERYQRQFAVLFIDLDRFKVINDSLGHDAGDMLLVEIAGRLRRALRSSDVVARLGGDEFVVILEEAAEHHEVARIAGDLLSVLSQPLQLSGHECHTTASIGIAMYPSDGSDMQTLTKNADMAMYLAKEDGKNGFRFFTKEIKTQSIERLTLESALRRALEREQFSLHYQPKVDMVTGQITGVEALLRWNHPELGLVSPGQFIPLAEETGLIVPIGRWVLTEACAQNMAWQRRGLRPVTMAVNLSPRQFADPHLLQDVDEALLASGMSPVLLQLEVTESMVMRNVTRAIKVLDAVQSRGIRLAIDDFGTGYSSMSLMKQFPIDTIKIDRSFVRDLPNDSEDQAIAQAIISMGKALGMTVIAEGVETVEQETFLRNHACDEMQGFLFSKPLPPRQMADLLRSAPLHASPPLQPEAGAAAANAVVAGSASRSRLKGTVV